MKDRWSIGQIFDHLCLAGRAYEAPLRRAMGRARRHPATRRSRNWKPTWFGRALLWSVHPDTAYRSSAPSPWRPSMSHHRDVIDNWLSHVDVMRGLMQDAIDLDLTRSTLSSPAFTLIRLNIGDVFAITTQHTARHMRQVRHIILEDEDDHSGTTIPHRF